jgi:hypothetical protein
MKAIPTMDRLKARIRLEPPPTTHDRLGRPIIGPCWIWPGATNRQGYGTIRVYRERRTALTHRVAYEAARGPTNNEVLDHLCRVPLCCNPDHLEDVSMLENIRRGDPPGRTNAFKTHCPYGHPYDEANTRWKVDRKGRRGRSCKACDGGGRRYQRSSRSPYVTGSGNTHADSSPGADVPGLAASLASTN